MIAPFACMFLMASQDKGFQYRVYENDKISAAEFAQRRQALLSRLPAGNVTVLITNPARQRTNDTGYRFRPNSYLWYLTGCEEEGSALILAPDGISVDGKFTKEVLFVMDKSVGSETWTGIRMGPKVAKDVLGVNVVASNGRFSEILKSTHPTTVTLVDRIEAPSDVPKTMQDSFDDWAKAFKKDNGARSILDEMRSVKSPAEIALTWKSINATVAAHMEALKSCEPGMREYELSSLVEYIFARNGCESVAYGSIVGSGVNSCVLHYEENRKTIQNGDFICMDVGGEYHGYASDVTRSYPANGKFTPEQKAIYEIVQQAQEEGVKACKPGASFGAAGQVATRIVTEGLNRLGILKGGGSVGQYFMHGTSHYVGLDVHDVGSYGPLKPGNILTVEPGIYIREGSPCDQKWWNIGVRIEDTVLIGEDGPINMSGKTLPRSVPEIEKLMAQKGLGNNPSGKLISQLFPPHSSQIAGR